MRGAPELIGRSATAQDPDQARRLWTVSGQLTGGPLPGLALSFARARVRRWAERRKPGAERLCPPGLARSA